MAEKSCGRKNETISMEPPRRRGAFELTDFILYTLAICSSFYELAMGSARNYWTNPSGDISSGYTISIFWSNIPVPGANDIAIALLSLCWALFILVVFYRNYIVMHGIDHKRQVSDSVTYSFFSLTKGHLDFWERTIRFLIVLTVIISAKGIYGQTSFGENSFLKWVWLPNYIDAVGTWISSFFSSGSHSRFDAEFRIIFLHYILVLFLLSLLFLFYDYILVRSTYNKYHVVWKEIELDSEPNTDSVVNTIKSNADLDSLLRYLCYIENRGGEEDNKQDYNFLKHSLKDTLFRWLKYNSYYKLYFGSYKFKERLSIVCVCVSSLFFLGLPTTLPGFVLACFSLLFYILFSRKNRNWLSDLGSTLKLQPVTDYFFTLKVNSDNYEFKEVKIIPEKFMNILRRLYIPIVASSLIVLFIYINQSANPDYDSSSEPGIKDRIVVWQTESDKKAGLVLQEIEIDFERKFPNTDLQIETVGWGDLSKRLGVAMRQGNFPNVSHLQPFMVYSLKNRDLLLPITDLINLLEADNGEILPAVKNLQKYGSDYYGIAYAVGSTFWLLRSDMLDPSVDIEAISTWSEYIDAINVSVNSEDDPKVILPGGSPFFIHQLYGELLANAGGKFFDPNSHKPTLNTEEHKLVLNFFRLLSEKNLISKDWANTSYTDQFALIAKNAVISAPVTYSRAARTIEANLERENSEMLNSDIFRWLKQPTPTNDDGDWISTIDAEPYVVFSEGSDTKSKDGLTYEELSIEYLKMFYSPRYYEKFTQAVPVQLTPIFTKMSSSEDYLESVGVWMDWHNKTMEVLSAEGRTRPIMMPDVSEKGRELPFLLEFEASKILSNAVSQAINKLDKPIVEITEDMQNEAIRWKRRFN